MTNKEIVDFIKCLPPDLFKDFWTAMETRIANEERIKLAVDSRALSGKEQQLIQEGNFISAIKECRARTGHGLKEAKNICDQYKETLIRSGWVNPNKY